MRTVLLLNLPPETLLHILSYLDLPDLASCLRVCHVLRALAADPVLHHYRLRVVAPSRVAHALFRQAPPRPTVGELVARGVMRGLGIERRWRAGLYFYTHLSVKQYESSLRIQRTHTKNLLSHHLRRLVLAPTPAHFLRSLRVLPDLEREYASPRLSRSLLPVVRKLKWSIKRDVLSQRFRDAGHGGRGDAKWVEGKGRGLVCESERIRLAVCPDVRKIVAFFEGLNGRD
ncbi:hypothetical protein PUNSTDRAFT_129578 [Punctularia strigosozonata HHB-11173 SS5]|uniref:uncharacterized protein n=1 Tax=Punctularia strigosozonata (strain HHB-11173) TaxID=741275 RepID=UPI00044175F8|nr:uncharacterized protein PUNSTDRAFT_129578 [Punctularia strigosozonata HHB-11173 SS5]EIN13914.1 hypothetical protein PUNSTDRAFT_129578 [Punctularia strigosozonata HHB-11173 SS5]